MSAKRPVGRQDFEGTTPPIRDAEQVNRWGVCLDGYELRTYSFALAQRQRLKASRHLLLSDAGDHWKTYKPLEEQSDMFLKFARLSRQNASADRALGWCGKYGVLGLAGDYHWGWTGENSAHRTYEDLAAFDAEVERAAGVLALYEAALNRDREAAEHYAFERYPQISAELGGVRHDVAWDPASAADMVESFGNGDYLAYALEAAAFLVESTVRESCFPTLRAELSSRPTEMVGGWGFKNLRGAMYLQMYWLMSSGGNFARCQYCGGVISLSSTSPGARKPRGDRKFCDDNCRQKHHYHKTKHRRENVRRD